MNMTLVETLAESLGHKRTPNGRRLARVTDEVVMGAQLPDRCEKCHAIWPCPDVQAIAAALQEKGNGAL